MVFVEQQFQTRIVGVNDVIADREARPSSERRAMMQAQLEAWIAGELEPLQILCRGHARPESRETVLKIETIDPKTRKRLREFRWVPIARAHVLTVKYRPPRPDALEDNEPFLRVVLDDGSKIDLPAAATAETPVEHALTDIEGIGARTAEKLAEAGFDTIDKLANAEEEALKLLIGDKAPLFIGAARALRG